MHLNAEFQRRARRDKKAFLSDQGKEIEENNGMGKTRDLFKKSRDTKGTLHAKMGFLQIQLLLQYLKNDPRKAVKRLAIQDLKLLANKTPHTWSRENIQVCRTSSIIILYRKII